MLTPNDSEAQEEALSSQNPNMSLPEDSQSFPFLTLEAHDNQAGDQPRNFHDPKIPQNSLETEQNLDDPEVISAQSSQPNEQHLTTGVATKVNFFVYQRGIKKKKKGQKRRPAEEKKVIQKLEVLYQNIKPIPFVPSKHLDFSSHEELLGQLGLWEFVNIQFDRDICSDLLVQLIASFNPTLRCSYVNGVRIKVNRADLARALKLKDHKVKKTALTDELLEELQLSADSKAFILDFVDSWVLLHDDTWMMPKEVNDWIQTIKDGNFEKIDWASMIWFMVEKELIQGKQLTNCYYASYLQCLMKHQREGDLFPSAGEEHQVTGDMKMEKQEEDDNLNVKNGGDDRIRGQGLDLEEQRIELSLGQESLEKLIDKVDKDDEKEQVQDMSMMDVEGFKVDEPVPQWILEEGNTMVHPFLQRCNTSELKVLDFDEERKHEEEEGAGEEGGQDEEMHEEEMGHEEEGLGEEEGHKEEEGLGEEEGHKEEEEPVDELGEDEEGGFHLSPKGIHLEGLSSGNLMHTIGSDQMALEQMALGSSMALDDTLAGDFLGSRDDIEMHLGGSSHYGNKREISHDIDDSHHSLNDNKRLRMDGTWNSKPSSEFDICMEEMQHCMEKAKMLFAAKEQICNETATSQEFLLSQLDQRGTLIAQLQKAKMEEQHKTRIEVYRCEQELCVMENLLEGYKKALKETCNAFAEYRARFPKLDEPLYKDVAGSGGLVLTAVELEKHRLKLEEEQRLSRLLIEKKVEEFEICWDAKFNDHHKCVESFTNKLASVECEIKLLKESLANRRVSETTTCTQNDS